MLANKQTLDGHFLHLSRFSSSACQCLLPNTTATREITRNNHLSLCGRNEAALREVAGECRQKGAPNVTYTVGDITDDKTLEAIVSNTVDKLGSIDALVSVLNAQVNNAGMGEYGPLATTSADIYDKLSKTNIRSVIMLTQLALPHLIKSRGAIVNVSSALSANPALNTGFYAMTKAAIDHFTRVLALQVGSNGVRVNGVWSGASFILCIGAICRVLTYELPPSTSSDALAWQMITARSIWSHREKDSRLQYYEAAAAVYPLGRVGFPEDIARAAFFLASNEAAFTTGQMLKVDGGFEVTRPKVAVS